MTPFESRRQRLLSAIGPNTAAVFVATAQAVRNNDVEHDFRQDSDVFYLTGFDEPETVIVLTPNASVKAPSAGRSSEAGAGGETPATLTPKLTMFVRPKDQEREVWDGFRHGVEGAKATFGADLAFTTDELSRRLPELLAGHEAVVYRFGNKAFDERLFAAIATTRRTAGRLGAAAPTRLIDPLEVLYEHRLRKSPEELDAMRRACAITAEAHVRAMGMSKHARFEYELEAALLDTFRKRGSERAAYGSIVGSGPNATVLHYRRNDRAMRAGELVLIDAGCEVDYYASDVTRTFPIGGTFSETQRAVYEVVLEAQLAAIAMVRPGVTQGELHHETCRVLTRGLVRLGVLEGDVDELVKAEAYKPYYMHKTGHWLGMDVHDVGAYFVPGADGRMVQRPLEPGMVITIEPGLYFGLGAEKAPERFRGIGVRIEDDILVTESGYENLTAAIPKTVEDVERACAG